MPMTICTRAVCAWLFSSLLPCLWPESRGLCDMNEARGQRHKSLFVNLAKVVAPSIIRQYRPWVNYLPIQLILSPNLFFIAPKQQKFTITQAWAFSLVYADDCYSTNLSPIIALSYVNPPCLALGIPAQVRVSSSSIYSIRWSDIPPLRDPYSTYPVKL